MSDAFAEICEHNNAGTVLALGAVGAFSKWVSSSVGPVAGPSDLIVPSAASDDLTVGVNGGGIYLVQLGVTFASNRVNAIHEVSAFLNNVEIIEIGFHLTVSNANAQSGNSDAGIMQLDPGDVVDLRINSSIMTTTVTFYHVTLLATSIVRDL